MKKILFSTFCFVILAAIINAVQYSGTVGSRGGHHYVSQPQQ